VFCEEKKSKCPKENFQSVKRGKMFKCGISGVQKKKLKEREKKGFGRRCLGGIFAKFVFTG